MKAKTGTARPRFMIGLMAAGAIIMGSLAVKYISLLQTIDEKTEVKVFFGLLSLQEQSLTSSQQAILFVLFVILGLILGASFSAPLYNLLVKARKRIETMSAPEIWAGVAGLVIGLVITVLLLSVVKVNVWISAVVAITVCSFSVIAFLSTKEQIAFFFSSQGKEQRAVESRTLRPKILDTNVIIDGRIADVCKAGFVEGPILVPRFVLEELQQIADSGDPLKRARGRRGLDILNNMQKELQMQVKTVDASATQAAEDVDSRLIRLAQEVGACVITNDFNLNKVAALQGIQVLNINELANALKPVVLPGEEMSVTIIKEGKEANQGIGYMDDGTMIVVEGGKRHIGETLDVIVTSVLQTVAGKMIFGNIKAEQTSEEDILERNVRSYYGGRQRKKIR